MKKETYLGGCLLGVFTGALLFASSAAFAATVTIGEGSLSGDQLTIPVTLDEAAEVGVYIGAAGPRDGDPANLQALKKSFDLGSGTTSVTVTIPVGAKIAYSARTVDGSSETRQLTATDTSEYVWVNDAKGNWHDPANWTRKNTGTDGYENIGYPAYSTGNIRFNGGQTAEVTADADYTGFGDIFIDNTGLNLTIHGNGHTLDFGNTHTTSDNNFVLDNVRFITRGSYTLGSRSTMQMLNGTYFQTTWEFNVNGTNAKLYVGPGCEIYAGSGWWYTFRLDGNGAEVVLDDGYIHSRGFRIGSQRSDATPTGFIFKGENPRLELNEEFVVCKAIPGNAVFEFYVPRGGYAQPPISKTDNGKFIALDNKWQDHESSSSVYTPVAFKVSRYSPFYQDETTSDVCLFDWSATDQGIKTSQVILAPCENEGDYLELRTSAGNVGKVDADQIWAVLHGTGTPADLPTLGANVSATPDSSTGKVSVKASVEDYSENYTTKLQLWVAAGGPKDDLPSLLTLAEEKTVTASGEVAFDYQGLLGAKVCYKLVLVAGNGTKTWTSGLTAVASVIVKDDHSRRYQWINGRSGLWSDPANWTLEGDDDGRGRLGYPTWGSNAGFYGNQTDVITIDADYESINEIILGWGGADLTFVSAAKDAETGLVDKVYTIETGGFRDGQYENVKVTLDGVSFDTLGNAYPGTYAVRKNSSLHMYNGAKIRTRWAFSVEGENAYAYIGSNCTVYVTKAEPYHRLGLSGKDAEIVLDDGTIDALYLRINDSGSSDAPKGITFRGKKPQLLLEDRMGYVTGIAKPMDASPTFTFEIPAGGYDVVPVRKNGWNDGSHPFMERASADIPVLRIKVDDKSPFFKAKGKGEFRLVEWAHEGKSKGIDKTGVSLVEMAPSRRGSNWLYYSTSVDGVEATAIDLHLYAPYGLVFTVR
jgi:hypothetical protein